MHINIIHLWPMCFRTFFLYFCILYFFVFFQFFLLNLQETWYFPFGFLSDHCSTPPQATFMQGRPVDVDTVAKFGSMYKSPKWRTSYDLARWPHDLSKKRHSNKKIKHIGHTSIKINQNRPQWPWDTRLSVVQWQTGARSTLWYRLLLTWVT